MQTTTTTQGNSIINDLMKAINGEYNAICMYEHLAKLAPNQEVCERILEIRQDEIRHYLSFSQLFTCLTGQTPTPQLSEEVPENFVDGIYSAFFDEQQSTEFYHEIARNSYIPMVSQTFLTNAADEQTHAVWFLFYINQYS